MVGFVFGFMVGFMVRYIILVGLLGFDQGGVLQSEIIAWDKCSVWIQFLFLTTISAVPCHHYLSLHLTPLSSISFRNHSFLFVIFLGSKKQCPFLCRAERPNAAQLGIPLGCLSCLLHILYPFYFLVRWLLVGVVLIPWPSQRLCPPG